MGLLLGEDRILYLKEDNVWVPIGCLTSNNLEESVEMLSTTTRVSNGWRTGVPTNQQYSIPFEGLQIITGTGTPTGKISYDGLKILKRARERIEWRIADPGGSLVDQGFGYITFIGEGNQVDEFLSFNGLITGDGEPIFTQVEGDIYQDSVVICYQDNESLIF